MHAITSDPRYSRQAPKRRRRSRRETSAVSRYGWVTDAPKYGATERQAGRREIQGQVS